MDCDCAGLVQFVGQATIAVPPGQYEFATHASHEPPLLPLNPATQTQLAAEVLLGGDAELAGHVTRFPLSQNPFAGHSVHGPPAAP